MLEIDHLLALSQSGLTVYTDEDALNDRITEWLETPMGTIADRSEWGNALFLFKHQPDDISLRVIAEMMILDKLPKDVKGVVIKGVRVEFLEIDLCHIVISHSLDIYEKDIAL